MSYQHILFEIADGIARLTLNRPEKLNSLTAAMHGEMRDAIAQVHAAADVRVLLLTGAGRAFCAGQDLADPAVSTNGMDLGAMVDRFYAPLVRSLRALPLPVVCAVNGVAAGAGANLALACDLVLAKQSASFIQPFCNLGLLPDTGGTYFCPAWWAPHAPWAWPCSGQNLQVSRRPTGASSGSSSQTRNLNRR